MMRITRCGLTAAVLVAATMPAAPRALAQAATPSRFPSVALPRTQLRPLRSERVGQDYQLRIRLPEGYDTSSARYPVLYLLDGDLMFGMASEMATYLQWGGMVPALIIVAPGYGSIHGPANGGTNMRARDYSVFGSQSGFVPGGGERFLRFLREELIPYVDRELRTDTADRVLAGFSRGADFTVYSLLTAPDLFHRYISIDSYYDEYVTLEEALAGRTKVLGKRVFLSSRFPRGAVHVFSEKLRARGYVGLDVRYADAHPRHFAAAADGLTNGLAAVFNKQSVYELLLPIATTQGLDAVVAEYRRLKSGSGTTYEFGERELVDLGIALMNMRRPADAIAIYKLNLDAYPQSAQTFARLGTAFERNGEPSQALDSFRRAVALNPADRLAADAVKRLEAQGARTP